MGISLTSRFLTCKLPDLPGITALKGDGWNVTTDGDSLYRAAVSNYGGYPETAPDITMIPYYAWANRGEGAMRVWLRQV
jgi:DUF1680 family protein